MSFEIELPDGTVLEAPDGADASTVAKGYLAKRQGSAVQNLQDFVKSKPAEYDPSSPAYQAKYGPTSGSSFLDNARAGAGKAFVDLGRGVGQTLGLVSRQDVAQSRAQDAPLSATVGGKVGNVVGNVAATVPALAIPGAATIPGAAAIGGALGFLQPSTSTKETLLNTGIGGAAGAAGQYIGNKVAGAVGSKLASRQAASDAEATANAVRDDVLSQARKAGYVIPPTDVNPSMTATALESVSGKAATRQAATVKNAPITNGLVRQDLGIADNVPITRAVTAAVRAKAGKAYQAVQSALPSFASDGEYASAIAKIRDIAPDLEKAYPGIESQASPAIDKLVDSLNVGSHDSETAIALSKALRNKAAGNFRAGFAQGGNPDALAVARAQMAGANAIEDLIGRKLANSAPNLKDAWDAARTTIAKTYQVDAALKGGNVNAVKLAAQLQKGRPVSGGMGLAAQFADHFPDAAKLPKGGVGVSKLSALLATGGIAEAYMHGGIPGALAAAGAVAAPYATRGAILSGAGQGVLAAPKYAPGMLGTAGLGALGAAGRYGTLPAYLASSQLVQAGEQNPPQSR